MQKLDPKSVWIFFIRYLLIGIFLGGFLGIYFAAMLNQFFGVAVEDLFSLGFAYLFAVAVISFIWARWSYHYYRYEITDTAFKKEFGVIYKMYVTIPYDRIQNVDIVRGIVARILGLSRLVIQTAGISGSVRAEGVLPALSKEVAEQLRDALIRKAGRSKTQGL